MRKYLIQGIPLARSTREAWKEQGWAVLRRGSTLDIMRAVPEELYENVVLLNCGLSQFTEEKWTEYLLDYWGTGEGVWLFNPGEQIRLTRRPGDLRDLMEELLPPAPHNYPVYAWAKGPGHGGNNKTLQMWERDPQLPKGWDLQVHIPGDEFRLVTVNGKVVQCFERKGHNGAREYTWRGVREAPRGSIPLVKKASEFLPRNNVIAWDIILDGDEGYILEANTAPGVNTNTARRITEAIHNLVEGDNAQ